MAAGLTARTAGSVVPDRILVTGAAGFIGSAVVRALVAEGRQVVALIEPGGDARGLDLLDVERVTGDLRDPDAVRAAVAGCRAVCHVAALYRFWSRDRRDFYEINVQGTRNVLAASAQAGVGRATLAMWATPPQSHGGGNGSQPHRISPACDHGRSLPSLI